MFIHTYTCFYILIHIYTCSYVFTHIYMFIRICTYLYMLMYMFICLYMVIHIYTSTIPFVFISMPMLLCYPANRTMISRHFVCFIFIFIAHFATTALLGTTSPCRIKRNVQRVLQDLTLPTSHPVSIVHLGPIQMRVPGKHCVLTYMNTYLYRFIHVHTCL